MALFCFVRIFLWDNNLNGTIVSHSTEFTGHLEKELLELLGIQQLLTFPYHSQGNGIVERSHRMVSNMIWAHLANRDDRGWVDVLPGVMLAYNEMEQGRHSYLAPQVMWGQGMNLPNELMNGTKNKKEQDQHQFVKNMGRELREISEKVRPFNSVTSDKWHPPTHIGTSYVGPMCSGEIRPGGHPSSHGPVSTRLNLADL